MHVYSNILALLDEGYETQSVIYKACNLAQKMDANLTFLQIVKPPRFSFSRNKNTPLLLKKYGEEFSNIISVFDTTNVRYSFKLRESGSKFEGITQELQQQPYDLIIKNNHKHSDSFLGMRIEDDWHLLRDVDTPVMLVGEQSWQPEGNILLALEVDELTPTHQTFNNEMLDHSTLLASLLNRKVHLVNCYFGESNGISIKKQNGGHCELPQKLLHQQKMMDYLNDLSSPDELLHVEMGLPDDVIPEVAEQIHSDLVVLGAGEHTGLSHLFSGHTSEYVIDKLHCDVLALKPH